MSAVCIFVLTLVVVARRILDNAADVQVSVIQPIPTAQTPAAHTFFGIAW